MKIEAEVCSALYAFTSGCADRSAQERASIDPLDSAGRGSASLFDCEHFQFIDDDDGDDGDLTPMDPSPRSVLRKRGGKPRGARGRVTFDEAVTLYADDSDGPQLLALTTGPEIVCSEVYYTFEPPIEYQDVPPFEPPAEYRDDVTPEPPADETAPEPPADETTPEPAADSGESACGDRACDDAVDTACADSAVVTPDVPDRDRSDVAVSKETESIDSDAKETADSAEESDQLFERFLEAEREFAVDEELNSVFHALENDFVNDGRNGALDDNFFRKLISLLSSAESETPVEGGDYFSSTRFSNSEDDMGKETEDDDNSQTHSRTLSEADSDCSISSQDTIIVRFGEEEIEQNPVDVTVAEEKPVVREEVLLEEPTVVEEKPEALDEVFSESTESPPLSEEKPRPLPRESLLMKNNQVAQAVAKLEKSGEESLSRQSSGEQSVNSGTSLDPPQDADDSTSSDSRSGEVEEEIRLDDIGYDEEDADDYDEESFRGMAHGNSKIRRIIKKNALQCTIFRGIEAKRRQQPGAKYPRPKSPLLSQESLVEKLKWLTTIDEHKDQDCPVNFHSNPPDVILSTGGIPVNGSIPHSATSKDDIMNQSAHGYPQPHFYQMQQRHVLPPPNAKMGYYNRHDGFSNAHHPSLPRQRMGFSAPPVQMMQHTLPYPQNRVPNHPAVTQWSEQQRPLTSMTVPRNFRDWRVIQRVNLSRNSDSSRSAPVPADYVRCAPNGAYPPPDVSRTSQPGKDELEHFAEQDSQRTDRIKKRYSLAEEDDDPTFGFARRPSVRGIQSRIQTHPSDGAHKLEHFVVFEDPVPPARHYAAEQQRHWNGRDYAFGPPHRASVAIPDMPGRATLPHPLRRVDPRHHSFAGGAYGTLPGAWATGPLLQAPLSNDERGVPEGASSSPKISSDSLYHAPVPDTGGPPHKEDGVIYYSLNV